MICYDMGSVCDVMRYNCKVCDVMACGGMCVMLQYAML